MTDPAQSSQAPSSRAPRPLQNRVTPFGDIEAASWRGALTGNRGCLHDDDGLIGARRWRHQNWVCCLTAFRGRKRDPMPSRRWTALFFWDEAAAFAAGHRPCGECRNRDYRRFKAAWQRAGLPGRSAAEMDRHLHRSRVTRNRQQIRFDADADGLPDGTFVTVAATPHMAFVIADGCLWHLSPADGCYLGAGPAPPRVTVLTPYPIVQVFRAGYRPALGIGSRRAHD